MNGSADSETAQPAYRRGPAANRGPANPGRSRRSAGSLDSRASEARLKERAEKVLKTLSPPMNAGDGTSGSGDTRLINAAAAGTVRTNRLLSHRNAATRTPQKFNLSAGIPVDPRLIFLSQYPWKGGCGQGCPMPLSSSHSGNTTEVVGRLFRQRTRFPADRAGWRAGCGQGCPPHHACSTPLGEDEMAWGFSLRQFADTRASHGVRPVR